MSGLKKIDFPNILALIALVILPLILCGLLLPKGYYLFTAASNRLLITSVVVFLGFLLVFFSKINTQQSKAYIGIYDILWLLFLLVIFISTYWTSNHYMGLQLAISWLMIYLLYKAVSLLSLHDDLVLLLQGLVSMIGLVSALVFYTYLFNRSLLDSFFSYGIKIEDYAKFFYFHANTYAYILGVSIPSSYYLMLNSRSKLLKILAFSAIVLVSFIILNTHAQTAKLVVFLPILFFIKRLPFERWFGKKKFLVFLVSVAGLVGLVSIFALNSRSFKNELGQLDSRFRLWESSLDVWSETPVFGVGANDWINNVYKNGAEQLVGVDFPSAYFFYSHEHSLWIKTITENGIVGLLLLLLILLYPLVSICKRFFDDDLAVMLLVLLGYYGLSASLYGFVYFNAKNYSAALVVLAIQIGIYASRSRFASDNTIIKSTYLVGFYITLAIIPICWFYKNIHYAQKVNEVFDLHADSIDDLEQGLEEYYNPWLKTDYAGKSILGEKAAIYLKKGRISEAFNIFEELEQQKPNTFALQMKLVNVLIRLKAWKNALRQIEAAEKINSQYLPLRLAKIEVLIWLNRFEEVDDQMGIRFAIQDEVERLNKIKQDQIKYNKRREFYARRLKDINDLDKKYKKRKARFGDQE